MKIITVSKSGMLGANSLRRGWGWGEYPTLQQVLHGFQNQFFHGPITISF